MRKLVLVAVSLLLTASLVGATGPSRPSVRVGTPEQAALAAQQITELHARLMAEQVELGVQRSVVVQPGDEELKGLYNAESEWPLRVGVVTPVGWPLSQPSSRLASLPRRS